MNAEREAMQRYDGALSKAVAIVAATAGDNYFTICNPFIDTCDPGSLWDELECHIATKSGVTRFNALTSFFSTLCVAGEAFSNLAGHISGQRSRIQSLFLANFTLTQFLDELESFPL